MNNLANGDVIVKPVKGHFITIGSNVHPVTEDGSRILLAPVRVEGFLEHGGESFASFKDADSGELRFWPAGRLQPAESTKTGLQDGERAPDRVTDLVRVPSHLLGKVLDGGKASAHAVKLLAIKASKGESFVLFEDYCHREYGISRHAFQIGMRLLLKRGAIEGRHQPGRRRRCVEKPLDVGNGRFVLFEQGALKGRASLLAFTAVVSVSPEPVRPSEAAGRIGVGSVPAVRKLVKQASESKSIAVGTGEDGEILVARRGWKFAPVKKRAAKNHPAKNRAAYSNTEGRDRGKEGRGQCEAQVHVTVPSRAKSAGTVGRTTFENESRPPKPLTHDPDWIVLKDWTTGANREVFYAIGEPDRGAMSLEEWQRWIKFFVMDADKRCGHVLQHSTLMQALEIAHEVIAQPSGGRFTAREAMEAIAVLVAKACLEGRTIRSLGFIAKRLLSQLDDGDVSAIANRKSWKPRREIDAASELAHQMLHASANVTPEIKFARDRLLTTSQLEVLANMIKEHSHNTVVDAYNLAQAERYSPGEGRAWSSWAFLAEKHIEAAKNARRKK